MFLNLASPFGSHQMLTMDSA